MQEGLQNGMTVEILNSCHENYCTKELGECFCTSFKEKLEENIECFMSHEVRDGLMKRII